MRISNSKNKRIGITIGDPCGIGPEIVAKALAQREIRHLANYTIIGDREIYRRYGQIPNHCSLVDVSGHLPARVQFGRANRPAAKASLFYLNKAVELLKDGEISGLVTAPVCKEAIVSSGINFQGHTEYLADAFGIKKFAMMFVTKKLKTVVMTRHIPLRKIIEKITAKDVYEMIQLIAKSLKELFQIANPRIAVCGINPHAGEKGTIGNEEITKIIPAIKKAKKSGLTVWGPLAADTLFVPSVAGRYDAIIAMYHDQGLIAVKTLYFSELVNLTIGLPFIRTSPAHGTAFDIAGKSKADASSMCEAIKLAVELSH